jgi:hypothetical protein
MMRVPDVTWIKTNMTSLGLWVIDIHPEGNRPLTVVKFIDIKVPKPKPKTVKIPPFTKVPRTAASLKKILGIR